MRDRINIRMSGLGGQGVVTSAHVIATAAYKDGKEAISNPFFGAEKRMAPSESYARISSEVIYDRGELVYPDIVMIFHPQVITMGKSYTMPFYDGLKDDGFVIINSNDNLLTDADQKRLEDKNVKVLNFDATEMAVEIAGTELASNMGMLGLLIGATDIVTMESFELALNDRFGKKYVASGGTATLDEAIKKKFAKKADLLAKNMETVKAAYEIGKKWAKDNAGDMLT